MFQITYFKMWKNIIVFGICMCYKYSKSIIILFEERKFSHVV